MSQPCARKNARSAIVALLPGRMTRSQTGSGSPGATMTRSTFGSSESGSNSSKLAMRARRGTAIVTPPRRARTCPLQRHGVLGGQFLRGGEMRDHPERRPGRALLDEPKPFGEKTWITAKLVDEKADDHRCVLGRDHDLRSDDLRDDAAAIDVADQDHGRIGGAGEAHVGDVAATQIDLGRAAGALDEHQIGLGLQPSEAFEHRGHQSRLHRLIFSRFGGADDAAAHDDLRAGLALRLQQHGVHVDARRDAASARLQRLGAADLAAVRRSPPRCSTCSAA